MKKTLLLSLLTLAMNTLYAQVPAYVPTDHLIGWYPFKGNADNNATPGALNGTVNGATPTTDRFGSPSSAYQLDGNTNNITIDTTFFNIGWDNYTISCWVNSDTLNNPNNSNHAQAIFNTIPHNGLALYFNWLMYGKYDMLAGANPPSSGWNILPHKRSYVPITIHAWKHLVMVKSEGANYSLYVDGALDTSYTSGFLATSRYCKMVLGRSDPGIVSEGFYGKIDDYGFWDRALTPCEIKGLFTSSAYLYITSHPVNVSTTAGTTATFSVTDTGTGNTYQWQVDDGTGFVNIPTGTPYSGITTATLTITGTPITLNGNKYRCLVNGAMCTDKSTYGTLTVTAASTGVAAYNNSKSIFISPNPTNGNFHIIGADNATVRIFDNTGRLLKKEVNNGKLSIAHLPAGLYLVELTNEDGNLLLRDKLIKQ